jgi:MoxR-like ATPase
MQEGQVTLDGETRLLPEPFIVIATQNPIDMEGTFPLPEAQLDRFMLRLAIGYPSIEEEEAIVLRFAAKENLPDQRPAINTEELLSLQAEVSNVTVEDEIRKYVMNIVRLSRENERVTLGGSPRSSIALFKASQAKAALSGRDFVIPDDVKYLAEPVLAHRIIPTSNARLRGYSQSSIVADVLSSVPVPIERQ